MNCPACRAELEAHATSCTRCGTLLGAATAVSDPSPTEADSIVVSVDLRPGTLFHGRYEILGPLGSGGMGMVYRAHDRTLDETVAIKVLRPDHGQDRSMAERFKSEIKLARKVRHRNVCSIHDFGEDRGLLYISMELVDGIDLKRTLKQENALDHQRGYDVAIQVAEGLEAVHDAGIVHRDLKTPNIMLDGRGVARLMDFGVAKRMGEGTVTATGHIVGTPEYMSPEQAQGRKVDFRSDIYALGVVVFEIFTGRVPFRGDTPISTILKHINDAPPLDGPEAARIPPPLKQVLRRSLAKDPAARFGSAREMADAMRAARLEAQRPEPPPRARTPAPRAQPARPRRNALAPWLLVLPVAAVAGGALVLSRAMRVPTAAAPAGATPTQDVGAGEPRAAPTIATEPPPDPPATARAAAGTTPSSPTPAPPRSTPLPAQIRPASPRPKQPTPRPSPVAVPSSSPARPVAPSTAVGPSPTPEPAAAAAASETGQLQVAVRPWGRITLDGKELGETPLDKLTLAAGVHRLRIRHPAYEVWEQDVVIRPNQTQKVFVDLPASGTPRRP